MPRTHEQILAAIDERTEWLVRTGKEMREWQLQQDNTITDLIKDIVRIDTTVRARAIFWGTVAGSVPVMLGLIALLTR